MIYNTDFASLDIASMVYLYSKFSLARLAERTPATLQSSVCMLQHTPADC